MFVLLPLIFTAHLQAEKPRELPVCQSIAKQCEAAGYTPGDHKKGGKGLWVDCVGAIAKGQTVGGVSATQAEAKSCADAAKSARKQKKAQKK